MAFSFLCLSLSLQHRKQARRPLQQSRQEAIMVWAVGSLNKYLLSTLYGLNLVLGVET